MSRSSLFLLLALPLALLSGCANENTALPSGLPGSAISGVAFGGQQPISGAKVYLLAANPAGYGSASLSMLTSASTLSTVDSIGAYVTTLPNTGGFNVASDYDCTIGYPQGANTSSTGTTLPGDEQVYLYVLGGSSGGQSPNQSSGLLAALGPCNALYSSKITVNELTTVAAAYALAGFATDATHISSSGTALALTGLSNSGLNANNLVNNATGAPLANSLGVTRPVASINTLGNILAACVNSDGTNGTCSTLFRYTESEGTTGTMATDTATAAVNLAHNPWPTAAGMAALYKLVPATGAPFSGGSTTQPNDFTVAMSYTNQGYTLSIAIDASGNAWTANGMSKRITRFSGTGVSSCQNCTFTPYVSDPYSIALDPSDNVWVANYANSTISEFSDNLSISSPVPIASGYTGGGLDGPCGEAIDASSTVWAVNYTNSTVSQLSNTGTALSPASGYTGGGLDGPCSIAIDTTGNVWAANELNNSLTKLSKTGIAVSSSSGYTGGGLNVPTAIAIDSSGNIWATNTGSTYNGNSVSEFSNTGVAVSTASGYTGGGLNGPQGIAIDGSGNVWVANSQSPSVTELTNAGNAISPSTGFVASSYPVSIAIDGSGDVWVPGYTGTVTEFIGAATPVVTPMVSNLIAPYGKAAVNRP
jgi:sugar lactone lactonase YvrE